MAAKKRVRPAYTLSKARLEGAEATLREMMDRKFPALVPFLEELVETGLYYGGNPRFRETPLLNVLIEIAAEDLRRKYEKDSSLIPQTIKGMQAGKFAPRSRRKRPSQARATERTASQSRRAVLAKRGPEGWK